MNKMKILAIKQIPVKFIRNLSYSARAKELVKPPFKVDFVHKNPPPPNRDFSLIWFFFLGA